jgi:uncharacterized membrane protein
MLLLAAACQSQQGGDSATGPSEQARAYDGIAEDETLHFTGTEPFWGGQVAGSSLTYSTPENQAGDAMEVERFAGRGGISFTGKLGGEEFVMMATPASCSDGMSDRIYPFTVTLKIGQDMRTGCGWTDRQPFEGPAHP